MKKEIEIKITYKNGDEFICNFPEDIIAEALASVFDNAKCVSGRVCKDGKENRNERTEIEAVSSMRTLSKD